MVKEGLNQDDEIDELIDRVHGPHVERDKNSPDPATEAKIQKAIEAKGKAHYDKEFGLEVPGLTEEEARAFMPERLRALLDSLHSCKYAYTSQAALDAARTEEKKQLKKDLRECRAEAEKLRRELNAAKTEDERRDLLGEIEDCETEIRNHEKLLKLYDEETDCTFDFSFVQEEVVIEDRKRVLERELTDGYIMVPDEQLEREFGEVELQKPHGYRGCNGVGRWADPYHVKCTKCDTEVRLWEWGVDYDIGDLDRG
jgi:hypothetical protein